MYIVSKHHVGPLHSAAPKREARFAKRMPRHDAQKVVVVHGGARDSYQVAQALEQAGLLLALVTDLFWSEEQTWLKRVARYLPGRLLSLLRQRSARQLPGSKVRTSLVAGCAGLLIDRVHTLPFAVRRWCTRTADTALGRTAGALAKQTGSALLSYSYFGFDAFRAYGRGGILFQAHPHPATMRNILRQELAEHPDCAGSLTKEWELSLPENDYQRLLGETAMASHWLVASTFTRDSLIENGISRERIRVVPYGVDLLRFVPDQNKDRSRTAKLRLLFVGRLNQRKGLKYLLQALQLLPVNTVHLMICGRVVDGLEMFKPYASQVEVRTAVSSKDLLRAYQNADLFVFPSIAEGFGQVLLEAMACGLPVLSTTRTAAPDLIDDGMQGFVVSPKSPEQLADRILWAIRHRAELTCMGVLARERAEQFTWQRFRTATAMAVSEFLNEDQATEHAELQRGAA